MFNTERKGLIEEELQTMQIRCRNLLNEEEQTESLLECIVMLWRKRYCSFKQGKVLISVYFLQ